MPIVVSTLSRCSCLLEGLGIRYAVVGALSAIGANGPKEERGVHAVGHNEVLHAESPRHTSIQLFLIIFSK